MIFRRYFTLTLVLWALVYCIFCYLKTDSLFWPWQKLSANHSDSRLPASPSSDSGDGPSKVPNTLLAVTIQLEKSHRLAPNQRWRQNVSEKRASVYSIFRLMGEPESSAFNY